MLSIVACGAPAAGEVGALAQLAIDRGWTVTIAATPSGLAFIDRPQLEQLTGRPVFSEYRKPDEPRHRGLPEPTAMIVAPATFNTINKLAAGITDTYALGLIADAIGNRIPVLIVPYVNASLAGRRPFRQATDDLRSEGVRILLGDENGRPPHIPGQGATQPAPWLQAITEIEQIAPAT